jgi:alpha-D-ribose 1-methylphosphonate 5-triphosphate synthase subunit PhnH
MGNLLILFIAGEFMKATLLRVLARLVGTMHIAYPRLLDLAILPCRQQLVALRRTTVIEATLVAGRI